MKIKEEFMTQRDCRQMNSRIQNLTLINLLAGLKYLGQHIVKQNKKMKA